MLDTVTKAGIRGSEETMVGKVDAVPALLAAPADSEGASPGEGQEGGSPGRAAWGRRWEEFTSILRPEA